MAAMRGMRASVRSVGPRHCSDRRRAMFFLLAVLFPAGLAVCSASDHSEDLGKTRSQEPRRQTQAAPDLVVLAQDSFDGKFDLDWDIVNPRVSYWSLSKNPGTLTITTRTGTFTRQRTDYRNLFLIDNPADPSQDFQVTACLVSFRPKDLWNQAGLVLWNDADNFLTLVYEWGEGPPELGQPNQRMFTACVENEGRPIFSWYYAPQDQEKVWLRVAKKMNRFELSTSKDGATFTPLNPMRARGVVDNLVSSGNGIVRRVGLFAGNGSARDAAPLDASFDSFEVKGLKPPLPQTKRETETPSSFRLSDLAGTWSWSQDPWHGDFVLKMDGDLCTGTLDDVYEGTFGDRIVDVNLSEDHIALTREGAFGIQRWEGTLKNEDGVLKIVDGRWTKERSGASGSFTAEKKSEGDASGAGRGRPEAQAGTAVNLGPNVNSGCNEGSPSISADGMTLYFDALARPGGLGGWDIWMSRAKAPHQDFSPALPLPAPVNSPFDESGPCLSDDGLTLYFASNRPGGSGGSDLWTATRKTTDDPWGEPVNLGPTVNSRYNDGHPSISADGLTLYFDSRRPGAPGQSGCNDIYMTKRATVHDAWGKPEPLAVNTEEHEYSPDIARDGLTLYYDSCLAGRDLWVTKRAALNEAWCKGIPLGSRFNTAGIDTDPSLSADGSLLYFVSDRPGGQGEFDIWVVRIQNHRTPEPRHRPPLTPRDSLPESASWVREN